MVPNLCGLPFLPAARPHGTVDTVSNSRPEKGRTILQWFYHEQDLFWLRDEEKYLSIIFVQFKCNAPSFHVSPRQIWTLIQPHSPQYSVWTQGSLSHAGPAHMREASHPLSILSTGLVGERPWGQVPEQPLSSLSLRSTKTSFSRTFYLSPPWTHLWSLDGASLDSSFLSSLWYILGFLMVRLKKSEVFL